MRIRSVALLAAAAALVPASVAGAAEPSSGSISQSSTTTKWTGEYLDPLGLYDIGIFFVGDTSGTCAAPHCDTYTLNVTEWGDTLTIRWLSSDADNLAAEVVDPSGRVYALNDAELVTDRTFEAPPATGEWIVRTYGTGSATYEATATLSFAPPEGGEAPAPPVTAPPAAEPQPAPAPQTTAKASVAKSARSAKRIKRSRSLPVKLRFSAPVTNVRVGLVKGSKTYASATAKKVDSSATVRVKPKRTVKPGSYKLVIGATDGQGRRVAKVVSVKIGR